MTRNEMEALVESLKNKDWFPLFVEGWKHRGEKIPDDFQLDNYSRLTFSSLTSGRELAKVGMRSFAEAPAKFLERLMDDSVASLWADADGLLIEAEGSETVYNTHSSDYRDAAAAYGEDWDSYERALPLFSFKAYADGKLTEPLWYGTVEWNEERRAQRLRLHNCSDNKESKRWKEKDEELKLQGDSYLHIVVSDRESGQELQTFDLLPYSFAELKTERGVLKVNSIYITDKGNLMAHCSWLKWKDDQGNVVNVNLGETEELASYQDSRTRVVVDFVLKD